MEKFTASNAGINKDAVLFWVSQNRAAGIPEPDSSAVIVEA
ncbi:MAG: hypothetical protein Q8M94_01235 [Ignavibacteria bacterium]|nr:hypothetical protein [Ignavibacteria bacterium]